MKKINTRFGQGLLFGGGVAYRSWKFVALAVVIGFGPLPAGFARDNSTPEERLERLQAGRAWFLLHRDRAKTASTSLSPEERLGALLYNDKNLSLKGNISCASCHQLTPVSPFPAPGFVDPANVVGLSVGETSVSKGSVSGTHGGLNAPSSGYAAFSPFFHWDSLQGQYIGGQFWNGRANTLAEQAAGPVLNPVEMGMANKSDVVARLKDNENYVRLFESVYQIDLRLVNPYAGSFGSGNPPPAVIATYEAMTKAIAAFEKTRTFNRFTSKFDFYLAQKTSLTSQESHGLTLFNGAANCASCHLSTPAIAPDGSVQPPMFTDFSYDNIGLPRNVNIPDNPAPNPGLGGRADIAARDPSGALIGKHKVMSLRNIALTPPYGHNGVFRTLDQIVHFYNTRDTLNGTPVKDITDNNSGVTAWPAPEIPQTVNKTDLGHQSLSLTDEADLVAFLRTLTDGYPDWGNDGQVPTGTPSPYASMPFPPFP